MVSAKMHHALESRLPRIALLALTVIIILHLLLTLGERHDAIPALSATQPLRIYSDSYRNGRGKAASQPSSNDLEHSSLAPKAPSQDFPHKIWQTSRTGPAGMEDSDRENIITWTKLNPRWRYESLTAQSSESYVRERFAHRPDLVDLFVSIGDPILRADLVRYMVLLGDGGLYCDLDTRALAPIDEWVPAQYRSGASVVIGVEYDRLDGVLWADWTLDLQFTTWSVLAKPNHPLMERVIDYVVQRLQRLSAKEGKPLNEVHATFHEVLDTTGPALFSHAVYDLLTERTGKPFTWENVTGLQQPWLVSDILILPVKAFASGQAHSHAGEPTAEQAYVQHLFKGSWKAEHPLHEGLDKMEKELQEHRAHRAKVEKEREVQQDKDSKSKAVDASLVVDVEGLEQRRKEAEAQAQEQAQERADRKEDGNNGAGA